ncbi:lipoyl(octanoyl) transferase LipB [Buchnera aphidicola]|uniref:lipoyl(octanoyl) transferase LipB n=1 Tax=Buchnera aphidicola TaxID=9 RepID=UPI0031B6B360
MSIIIRDFGICDWNLINFSMNMFTNLRNIKTKDELWLLEYFPVFTRGISEKSKFLSYINQIPVFLTNRGGKMTYHGPGQLIIYFLIDLRRRSMKILVFIKKILSIIKETLQEFFIFTYEKKKFPGLYIDNQKISSLGLRVVHGCIMHGFSINVKMNLLPFTFINVCGIKSMKVIDMFYYNSKVTLLKVKQKILKKIFKIFSNIYCLT